MDKNKNKRIDHFDMNKINKHENGHTNHTCTPRVFHLLPSNKWAILYVELLWAKQTNLNDHSPSIKLFKTNKNK